MQAEKVATTKVNFYDLGPKELGERLTGMGKEKFRTTQLFQWVYKRGVTDFDNMSNLSAAFRKQCKEVFFFTLPKIVHQSKSEDGTHKLLVDVGSGKTVECVIIPGSGDRLTLCVSSEVGCNMACQFCFTGKQKLQRRLDAWEIVGQFMQANRVLAEAGLKVTNIVFMGMGEPLDNLDNVLRAVDVICDDQGLNFSRKKITVSTSGIVPLIPALVPAKVRLAVSLNASTNEMRDEIMPINKRWNIETLMQACKEFADAANDRVTFEYVILKGVNDTLEDARRVHEIVRGVPCKVNLIPFNEHEGTEFKRPEMDTVYRFQNELLKRNHTVFIRKTMGRDIYAACGQLQSKFEGHPLWKRTEQKKEQLHV